MRLSILLCFVAILLSTGCAYEGVIVQKNATESPFYESVGIDGSYSFMLRDSAGVVRRQLVTPQVYVRYEVGEYFNDLQPGPALRDPKSDGKTMMRTAAAKKKAPQVAQIRSRKPASAKRSLPAKARASKPTLQTGRAVTARNIPQRGRTAAWVAPVWSKKPAPRADDLRIVTVARCR